MTPNKFNWGLSLEMLFVKETVLAVGEVYVKDGKTSWRTTSSAVF